MGYNSIDVFFALLRGGLWELDILLSSGLPIDYEAVFRLAEEQSVTGLVVAGLEHVVDTKIAKRQALPFIKKVLALEARNNSMNCFIASLEVKMREVGIETLLIKGQGIAQCYERPMWRVAGDVDLFLDAPHYEKASAFLPSLASSTGENRPETKHFAMNIDSWIVELHGTLRSQLGRRIDRVIDAVQYDTFSNGRVRVWNDGGVDILLPAPDNDVIFVFSHILQHFFRGGIGLRQICDWCRLLWTYRDSIDRSLLETRIREMRLGTEWKAFAAYAVDCLGMPAEAMPLYSSSRRWSRKGRRIDKFILEVGNFGHNRDNSFYSKYPYLVYKAVSLWRHIGDSLRHFLIFPTDSLRVFLITLAQGFKAVGKGE